MVSKGFLGNFSNRTIVDGLKFFQTKTKTFFTVRFSSKLRFTKNKTKAYQISRNINISRKS